jgi:hypothetical protein
MQIVANNTSIEIKPDLIEEMFEEQPVKTKCIRISWSLQDEALGEKVVHVIDDCLNTLLVNMEQVQNTNQ